MDLSVSCGLRTCFDFYTKYEEDLTQKKKTTSSCNPKIEGDLPQKRGRPYPKNDLTHLMISLALCLVISLDLYSLIPVVSSLH